MKRGLLTRIYPDVAVMVAGSGVHLQISGCVRERSGVRSSCADVYGTSVLDIAKQHDPVRRSINICRSAVASVAEVSCTKSASSPGIGDYKRHPVISGYPGYLKMRDTLLKVVKNRCGLVYAMPHFLLPEFLQVPQNP